MIKLLNDCWHWILTNGKIDITATIVVALGWLVKAKSSIKKFYLATIKKIKEKKSSGAQSNKHTKTYKKTPIESIPSESSVFHERIKKLFESKFNNIKLSYNADHSVLHGSYEMGFKKKHIAVYCYDCTFHKVIDDASIINTHLMLQQVFTNYGSDNECYFIIENGEFSKHKSSSIICKTESEIINSLIHFDKYLEGIVYRYENSVLPFTQTKFKKTSGSKTYIPPLFYVGKNKTQLHENFIAYFERWLAENSKRQVSILGDYGMGKTSLLKYLEYNLAKGFLEGDNVRIPIFISLTNSSPMHEGIAAKVKSFVSDNLGVNYSAFEKLMFEGKFLFLLDGFDEMGFLGTDDQRFKQIDAIWQLAYDKNKVILSGRPSYFPTEYDLVVSLRVENEDSTIYHETVYSDRITLVGFNMQQVEKLVSFYFDKEATNAYMSYIANNIPLKELCNRPSMLHIILQMLPELCAEGRQTNQSIIMNKYIRNWANHWISRQKEKRIWSSIRDEDDDISFIIDFFSCLSGDNYDYNQGNLIITANQVALQLNSYERYKLSEEEINGLQNEFLSGYFLQRTNNDYSFVHKSFYEYFVALKIVDLVKKGVFKHPLLEKKSWTQEIYEYVYYSNEITEIIKEHYYSKIPPLLILRYRSVKKARLVKDIFKAKEYWRAILIRGNIFGILILTFLTISTLKIKNDIKYLIFSVSFITLAYSRSLNISRVFKPLGLRIARLLFAYNKDSLTTKAFMMEKIISKNNLLANSIIDYDIELQYTDFYLYLEKMKETKELTVNQILDYKIIEWDEN